MRSLLLLAALLLAPAAAAQFDPSDPFAVTVQGDTLRGDVEFEDPLFGRAHVLIDGERREIEEFTFLSIDGDLLAVADGRRLAELVEDGRVRFYSRSEYSAGAPGFGTPGQAGYVPGGGGSSRDFGYIQVGDGPVEDATAARLQAAFQDNAESLRQLDRMRTLQTARWVVTGVGVMAFVAGAALMIQAEERGDEVAPFVPLAVGGAVAVGAGNFIFPPMVQDARRQAIEIYNED